MLPSTVAIPEAIFNSGGSGGYSVGGKAVFKIDSIVFSCFGFITNAN